MTNEIWLSIEDVCSLSNEKIETARRKCKSGIYTSKFEKEGKFKKYSILLASLPESVQKKYIENNVSKDESVNVIQENCDSYANAPEWARKQADKYLEIFNLTEGLNFKETKAFLEDWNLNNPDRKIAYSSYAEAKRKYKKLGTEGLLAKYGHTKTSVKIDEKYTEYFKSLYLREGAPSAQFCWMSVLGFAQNQDVDLDITNFPSCRTFIRKLRKEVPEQAIYLARYGDAAWNKKYASYISRNYDNIKAGSCWVSDHAQIDVAVSYEGGVCFPWVTVFRDIKTSKWLGWFLHTDAPNSDHIFQAFYYGVVRFGTPDDIYLDNGKDYRCKDFAGGRDNSVKVKHSTQQENSLMKNIGVNVHFALPYNAQTKPVERDFLKIKTFLSKGFVGYRGGKITERPEKLRNEIKNGKIMQFNEFKPLFDDFIKNFLNKKPSKGKALKGRCPDEAWAEEFAVKKVIAKDALKLFCMRTSRNVSIGRNGVYDSQLQLTYWDEWMICEKGRKVFLRRDINAYQEAWVFDAKTEEYLGKANANHAVSFLAKTNIEKAEYKKALEQKNKEKKILKNYVKARFNPSNEDIVENLKNSLEKTEFTSTPKVSQISNTKFDEIVVSEKKKNKKPLEYVAPTPVKRKIYLTEGEKLRDMARQAM